MFGKPAEVNTIVPYFPLAFTAISENCNINPLKTELIVNNI
jgi:hypothetical protein